MYNSFALLITRKKYFYLGEEIMALNPQHLTFIAACLVTSLAEVMVDQVDNLILPMVMYSALLGIPKVLPTLLARLPL